jgi:hypothetical protein
VRALQYTDIQGNIRVPLPENFVQANHPQWIELIQCLYTNHPMILKMDNCTGDTWPNDSGLMRLRDEMVGYYLARLGRPPNYRGEWVYLSQDELEASGA